MMVKRFVPLVVVALLAACSGQDSAPDTPADDAAVQPDAAATDAAPSAAPSALTEIPPAFLGDWDYVDGQCYNSSDAQLTVEPRRLQFYESSGNVTAVRQTDPSTIVVSMAMTGEGQSWTEETTFRLLDGGQVLESSFTGPDAGEPFRRKRCEALVDMPVE
jgi:hypothetical protein